MSQLNCVGRVHRSIKRKIVRFAASGFTCKQLALRFKVKKRTVKSVLTRTYLQLGITGGNKRVKLAMILYRKELENETLRSLGIRPE